jgi:hypothetical protein
MVGVYDGERVGLGRVVVDSTWHHWFSYNLSGLQDLSPGYFAGILDYYRNVAMWLATPAQRKWMLFAATWGVLVGTQPGAFDAVLGVRRLGERVVDVIGRTAPQCVLDELVATVAMLPNQVPSKETDDRSWIWALSSIKLTQLIVGGIAMRMVGESHRLFEDKVRGREIRVDGDQIRRLGDEGLELARRELADAIAEGSEMFGVIRERLAANGDQAARGEHRPYRPE